MGEEKIFYLGTRQFKGKDGTNYYVIDYCGEDNVPVTDFISALEFTEINKKMGDKHRLEVTGILGVNSRKKVYIKAIK